MSKTVDLGAVTAYAIAVKNGFEGTEAEWLASLKGADGEPGPEGPAGADGKTPVKGVDYYTEADKAELVSAVLDALPAAEEVMV